MIIVFVGVCGRAVSLAQDPKPQSNKAVTVELARGVSLKMARIPKGKFWMGSPANEADRDPDDEKQREVEITNEFYMGICEVSQGQWKAVMGEGNNPSHFRGDDLPVETVSWDDAKNFILKLNASKKVKSLLFRLPTEAEWEYACRGGAASKDSEPFHFKDGPAATPTTNRANFHGNYPYPDTAAKGIYRAKTTPVGSFEANRFGLFDMHGNVAEWCEDLYSPGAAKHVYRGGSYGDGGVFCRAASRLADNPDSRKDYLGFRLAASLSQD
ncbi:MAG: formylglycine-generating enzyme family protein [Gemmataceae bacterium]